MRQAFLKFAAEDCLRAQFAQISLVHRRIEAIEAEVRAGIEAAHRLDQLRGEARGGVHRHVKRYEIGGADGFFSEGFAREVETSHRSAALPQPGRRRRQPKRLPSQLISGNENDVHAERLNRPHYGMRANAAPISALRLHGFSHKRDSSLRAAAQHFARNDGQRCFSAAG